MFARLQCNLDVNADRLLSAFTLYKQGTYHENTTKGVDDVAGKGKEIGFRLFYNGVQVDKLPPEYQASLPGRLSAALTAYFKKYPEKYAAFQELSCVEKIPVTDLPGYEDRKVPSVDAG